MLLILDNFFPDFGRVRTRRGSELHTTVAAGAAPVETLFRWLSGVNDKLYAISGGTVYDVSSPMPMAVVQAGITVNRWRGVNFGNHGILVNGTDQPLRIDSTGNWVAHGFNGPGLAPERLFQVQAFKHRLFFLETGTDHLWYSIVDGVTGPLSKIDLGLVNGAGGNCLALGTITLDGGEGVDDLLVICMESGDILVYAGTDPSNAANWQVVGRFHTGRVIGDDPLLDFGADLIAITADGFVPILGFLKSGRTQTNLAISTAIEQAVTNEVKQHGTLAGWQGFLHPESNWLMFNIPQLGLSHQYVMNSQTGAWCRFTGLDAKCWASYKGKAYFGSSVGRVLIADSGRDDAGVPIHCVARTAYHRVGGQADKNFTALRPYFESGDGTSVSLGASVDFESRPPTTFALPAESRGTPWNAGEWDTFPWSSGDTRHREWRAVSLSGSAVSLYMVVSSSGEGLSWFATDIMFDGHQGALVPGR